MNNSFNLFVVLLFTLSCSKTYRVNDIIYSNQIRSINQFKFTYTENYYVTNEIPFYTYKKQLLIDSFKSKLYQYELIVDRGLTKEENELKRLYKSKLSDSVFMQKDTAKRLIVSFTDKVNGVNYSVIAIRHWDYINFRIIIPPLQLGLRKHLKNQCVNRAIQECKYLNGDGVIIDPSLSISKIIRISK